MYTPDGSPRKARLGTAAEAAAPPKSICHQPPMLKNLIMKGIVKA